MTYYSLRRRTFRAILVALAAAIVAIIVSTTLIAHRNIAMQRDREMELEASVLKLLLKHEALEGDQIGDAQRPYFPRHLLAGGVQFRVSSVNGKVSQSAGMPVVGEDPKEGFSELVVEGTRWRLLRQRLGGEARIDVAEPLALRTQMTRDVVISFILPIIFLILTAALIVDLSVDRMLRPLKRLSAELDRRDAEDLAPISGEGLPVETRALIEALNALLTRLGRTLERERTFSDNAAHELRTPLAVLKTRAQLLERRVTDNPAVAGDAREVVAAVDRASALIDRMLELVRVSGDDQTRVALSLSDLAAGVARDLAPLALEKGLEMSADIEPDVTMRGLAEALTSAMRNLVENAIRYTPDGGRIDVSLARSPGGVCFTVTDTGISIPPSEEDRIFERFHRGGQSTMGAGLGLAIVEVAVRQHDGRCHVHRPVEGGLSIGFEIPL